MLKLTIGVLAVALAGTASAGWRSLRVDGSSEAAFQESVAAFQEKLPTVRKAVFEQSLNDIWAEGTKAAAADDREYGITDYLRELDGLGYKEVVTFTDSTGDTADRYWSRAYAALFGPGNSGRMSGRPGSVRSVPAAWPASQVSGSGGGNSPNSHY